MKDVKNKTQEKREVKELDHFKTMCLRIAEEESLHLHEFTVGLNFKDGTYTATFYDFNHDILHDEEIK